MSSKLIRANDINYRTYIMPGNGMVVEAISRADIERMPACFTSVNLIDVLDMITNCYTNDGFINRVAYERLYHGIAELAMPNE